MKPVLNPLSSMLIVYASAGIATTKVRLPHAARNAVVISSYADIHQIFSGCGQEGLLAGQRDVCADSSRTYTYAQY